MQHWRHNPQDDDKYEEQILKKKNHKEDPSTTQLNTLVVSIKHVLTLFQLSIVFVLL